MLGLAAHRDRFTALEIYIAALETVDLALTISLATLAITVLMVVVALFVARSH
jgi:hypothetical protein